MTYGGSVMTIGDSTKEQYTAKVSIVEPGIVISIKAFKALANLFRNTDSSIYCDSDVNMACTYDGNC